MKEVTIQILDNGEVKIVKKEGQEECEVVVSPIRTYQDLIDNYIIIKGSYIDFESMILPSKRVAKSSNKLLASSEKVAKSMLAMAMISQLMPYYGGEITDEEWNNTNIDKYTIIRKNNQIDTMIYNNFYRFLAFHTKKQRDEFLKYNKRLVKDYLMID